MARRKDDGAHAELVLARHLPEHNGIKAGDFVRVKGVTGTFKFLYAYLTPEGEVDCYVVHGGIKHRAITRSFTPDRVTLDKVKNRIRPNVIEEEEN